MTRSRITGTLLMLAAALQMILFLAGIGRRSYAALALPMTLAMATVSALTFWLGFTMLQMDEEDEALIETSESA